MCQPAYIPTGYKLGDKRNGETVGSMLMYSAPLYKLMAPQTPQGSSTGSAVGVACGFAPLALGHETTGSLVSPSAVAGLYALKLTPGSTSLRGVLALTPYFDTVGAMGKSAVDVALACDALLARRETPSLASLAASADLSGMTIGFLDIEKWRLPAEAQNPDPTYYEKTVC